jgi:hypothetical protein
MGTTTRCVLAALISVAAPRAALADDTSPTVVSTSRPSSSTARHAIYLEALGRGGLWGLGYSYAFHRRWSVGAVGSLTMLDSQRIWSFSPYITAYLVGVNHHRWFVDAGPQVVRTTTPSPVPEWMGTSSTGVGAQVATGYELRAKVLVRVFAMGVVGKSGVAPWLGADVGWTF